MKILDGCYYPGCDHDHPEGKKFCGCDHKHVPTRACPEPHEEVCLCGDLVRDHCSMSHNHGPVAMEHRDCDGESEMPREATFPNHAVFPTLTWRGPPRPEPTRMQDPDEPEDDDWMDDPIEQESWIAKKMKEIK